MVNNSDTIMSKTKNFFSNFFIFLKSKLNFEPSQKKDDSHS